ncbi:heme d1 biosynthesis radical SAM protein NirJ [Pseudomonas sp. FW306-02-F02-AA]|uniref:Pre-heme d1 synthase n=1 Tax=Pseudomonas fluorescens TaxID=294 RepID=A0A0N9WG52_PSEFL|nr:MULTISPECIES: heme d1 biosynthesis radical SAM protein NirJ [Pseudomonas]ALI03597.1 heme d1 biosynthesis radical SAM protein NirJ [Pseudomonas fluorescens]PMZ02094.1 heme d1 biosynthesis radical SAM protein NirJ [Pseudomonas sp. FW306-02-F02-AB]PMZ08105.1 heme d1 biosynthesis radical SAM protein NirJ [Pseudomonas sp. FW306-02-H06C]PMZ14675.1 heme d1 biosynthesis radical SAM protein NirJ [Pseudomonas sp. FW306-02-F02-AA]PMZ20740.1 heme d1 biosynthesis radical SAM protein NirJ [Pseudomonas sp
MLRISQYLRALTDRVPAPRTSPPGSNRPPVVIWNLLRRCNLTCKHCYATSADSVFRDELDTAAALTVIDDLHDAGVKVLILSGGEPLLREDLFVLGAYARAKGFFVALSTNGTLIDEQNITQISAAKFDYVGISIDGLEATHDTFRQLKGSFARSMHAIQLCREQGIRVGLRTTLTQANHAQLPQLLALMREYDVQKFYLSHLNYSGRGKRSRQLDARQQMSREAMTLIFERAWEDIQHGRDSDFVSGNNDADAILLLQWVGLHLPEHYPRLEHMLRAWGGNASGSGIANIDNTGEVHPDTYWWQHSVGNVRHTPFRTLWLDHPDALLQQLRAHPRAVGGRCGQCRWLSICNGNTRTRAWAEGDLWGQDPGCHLSDEEIGIPPSTIIPCVMH